MLDLAEIFDFIYGAQSLTGKILKTRSLAQCFRILPRSRVPPSSDNCRTKRKVRCHKEDVEICGCGSGVPTGRDSLHRHPYPALKRRATLGCPFGTSTGGGRRAGLVTPRTYLFSRTALLPRTRLPLRLVFLHVPAFLHRPVFLQVPVFIPQAHSCSTYSSA